MGRPSEPPPEPLVLTHVTTGGERLYALNNAAAQSGLFVGQTLGDAKALEPGLAVRPADPAGDQRHLRRLARWAGRWSPFVSPDAGAPGEDGILLDITGCARVFGGEDRLMTSLVRETRALGLEAYAAAAPTVGLAWGAARFEASQSQAGFVIHDVIHGALDHLPVEALRIGKAAQTLRGFGITRVDALMRLTRRDLAQRFGRDLLRRVDQARGAEDEPITPLAPPVRYRTEVRVFEPLMTLESLKQAAGQAASQIEPQLMADTLGARLCRLTLYRVDGVARDVDVGTSLPVQDGAHITRLLHERLDRIDFDIGFGVDLVELLILKVERVRSAQGRLGETRPDMTQVSARLVDRLRARLGEAAVRRAAFRESHIPERASGWSVAESGTPPSIMGDRPLLILTRPEAVEALAEIPDGPPRRFVWRRIAHRVTQAEGPERIAPEWWKPRSALTRDYFKVETVEGRRFWLYREGLFGPETDAPRWYLHGAS